MLNGGKKTREGVGITLKCLQWGEKLCLACRYLLPRQRRGDIVCSFALPSCRGDQARLPKYLTDKKMRSGFVRGSRGTAVRAFCCLPGKIFTAVLAGEATVARPRRGVVLLWRNVRRHCSGQPSRDAGVSTSGPLLYAWRFLGYSNGTCR